MVTILHEGDERMVPRWQTDTVSVRRRSTLGASTTAAWNRPPSNACGIWEQEKSRTKMQGNWDMLSVAGLAGDSSRLLMCELA